MKMKVSKKLSKRAIKALGKDTQIHKAVEEMAELTKELSKGMIKMDESRINKIKMEIVDVIISVSHLVVLFGESGTVSFNKYFHEKVERLKSIVKSAE